MSETKEKQLEKKSVLLQREEELNQKNDSLVGEMQTREYEVDLGNEKVFRKLYKYLERSAPWDGTSVAGYVMLFNNIKTEKNRIQLDEDWDGIVKLRSTNVMSLWQILKKMTGNGFYGARDYVELMANCGESISKAADKVYQDNQELRDIHSELAQVQGKLDNQQYENDIEESDENESA